MNTSLETSQRGGAYEVLSPWADADPVPLRGIATRLNGLEGKNIGLFSNGKRAAGLTLAAFEQQLKEKVSSVRTSWYTSSRINTPEALTDGRSRFEAWVGGVDAVVLSAGD